MIAFTHYRTDSRVRREAEALVERGDSVDVICLGEKSQNSEEIFHGVRLLNILLTRYRGSNFVRYMISYIWFLLLAAVKVAYYYRVQPYHVIHVHTMPDFMVFASIIPKLLGAKVILDVHDLMPELYQSKFKLSEKHWVIRLITWIELMSIAYADRAIAVHQPHLDALCHHGNPREKFIILLNLPDQNIFTTSINKPKNPNISSNKFEMVYHGTVARRNGLEIAIRAVHSLKDQIQGIRLTIFGEGDDLEQLDQLVNELDLRANIKLNRGMIPMEDLTPILKQADVGIVPILYDEFTRYMLPVKLMEYVAMGIPVICSRTETIQVYFDDTMVEFFTAGDVNHLVQVIMKLFQNPQRRNEMIQQSAKFTQHYYWEQQKNELYQLIDTLIAPKNCFE